jgi:hypothetical protein
MPVLIADVRFGRGAVHTEVIQIARGRAQTVADVPDRLALGELSEQSRNFGMSSYYSPSDVYRSASVAQVVRTCYGRAWRLSGRTGLDLPWKERFFVVQLKDTFEIQASASPSFNRLGRYCQKN